MPPADDLPHILRVVDYEQAENGLSLTCRAIDSTRLPFAFVACVPDGGLALIVRPLRTYACLHPRWAAARMHHRSRATASRTKAGRQIIG